MDVRGEVFDPGLFSIPGRLQNLITFKVIPGVEVERLRLETTAFGRAIKSSNYWRV